jgi:DNA ligase-1
MRLFAVLVEELESRPEDADRVAALARYLRVVGRDAGALAGEWLAVATSSLRPVRPARLTQVALARAAAQLAAAAGMPAWLFEVGQAASPEAAEAIALLLPWPDAASASSQAQPLPADRPMDAAQPPTRPSLARWLQAWQAAASETNPDRRVDAIASTIARLDDPLSRRWAVRAVCGLVKPFVGEWQWQRAWAQAFDEDPHAVAWRWHLRRARGSAWHEGTQAPDDVPRPCEFAVLPDAPDEAHAGLLAAWQLGELRVEPRWSGLRVQVVRRGGDVAIWQRAGNLLNARLPERLVVASRWPESSAIEAVLFAWHDGRVVAVGDALSVLPAAKAASTRRRAPPTAPAEAPRGPSLHLALTDWHRWAEEDAAASSAAERRARLQAHWPVHDRAVSGAAPPDIFTTPVLPLPWSTEARDPARILATLATAGREAGWSGLVLRRSRTSDDAPTPVWVVRAALHRIRAVLQYVPTEALVASAASASALAFVACGFALWNRSPLSEQEQRAAMTAAMAGEFLPPPDELPGAAGLRLLPLVRIPIALPGDELERIHAWLRANAGLRFGGVHAVAPALVFEIGFTQRRESRRHRIGAVIDGARVLRWLHDAAPGSAHRAEDLG